VRFASRQARLSENKPADAKTVEGGLFGDQDFVFAAPDKSVRACVTCARVRVHNVCVRRCCCCHSDILAAMYMNQSETNVCVCVVAIVTMCESVSLCVRACLLVCHLCAGL
jgi:hypothetical protein